jgi:Protein of unknown function (DUF4013)
MDFQGILSDAFSYTKEGVLGNTNRWLKLIIAIICLGLPFNGYVMRVYRGANPAPEVDEWGTLFIDGLKLFAVGLVYALPLVIIWLFIFGTMLLTGFSDDMSGAGIAAAGMNMLLMMVMYLYEIVIAVLIPIASIRFARTNTFSEAFNFSGILGTIGKIGWLNYIIAIILVGLVVGIPMMVLVFGFIIVGILIGGASIMLLQEAGLLVIFGLIALMVLAILIVAPLFGIFQARCMTRVYDSAPPSVPAPL